MKIKMFKFCVFYNAILRDSPIFSRGFFLKGKVKLRIRKDQDRKFQNFKFLLNIYVGIIVDD